MSQEKHPFHYKTGNKKFPSTANIVERIITAGQQILVEQLPLTRVPESKIVTPGDSSSNFFNFKRGIIIKKGEGSKREYLEVGDTVYFSPMVFQNINYPNPDKKDKIYSVLSEESVIYFTKPIKKS